MMACGFPLWRPSVSLAPGVQVLLSSALWPPYPYGAANLATHVGDDPETVKCRRQALGDAVGVSHWQWLDQIHSPCVMRATPSTAADVMTADGAYTTDPGLALAVLTADCVPMLISDENGREVAALHAGWRGLLGGIVQAGVSQFSARPECLRVFIGPAIGPDCYEVGESMVADFVRAFGKGALDCYRPGRAGHGYLHLAGLARLACALSGVRHVAGGDFCTASHASAAIQAWQPLAGEQAAPKWYSYRRDGVTGRQVSAIWRCA